MDRTGNILDKSNEQSTGEVSVPYWKQERATASAAPSTPNPEQTTSMESYAATAESKKSHVASISSAKTSRFGGALLTVLILVIAIAAGFLVWKKLPRTYQACADFPGSKTADGRCTTFYNKVFVNWPGTDTSNDTSVSLDAVLTQTASGSASLTPAPTALAQSTTKGGIAVSPTPTTKPSAPQPTSKSAPTTTQAPASSGDWIKHNYPDQNLSLFVPRNYTGSNATRNRTSGITTFKLWTTNTNNPEIAFQLQSSSSVADADKNKQANTSVAGNPANKSGNTYTWQKNDVFYTVTCTTDAKLCDEIIGKVSIN
jgi:hypothetical protein